MDECSKLHESTEADGPSNARKRRRRKARFGRELLLNDRARAALDSVCTGKEGHLLFGKHDYRAALGKAIKAAVEAGELTKHKGERLAAYDFRHGGTGASPSSRRRATSPA